jgi:hypothetical protein
MRSPGMTDKQREALIMLLTDHRGKKNAIKAGALAAIISILDTGGSPITRRYIRQVIEENGLPVGASSDGYYWLETEAELAEYLGNLRSRIKKIAERIVMVESNYRSHQSKGKWAQQQLTEIDTA